MNAHLLATTHPHIEAHRSNLFQALLDQLHFGLRQLDGNREQ